jgi:hypothetical protein
VLFFALRPIAAALWSQYPAYLNIPGSMSLSLVFRPLFLDLIASIVPFKIVLLILALFRNETYEAAGDRR